VVLRLTPKVSGVAMETIPDGGISISQTAGGIRLLPHPDASPVQSISLFNLLGERIALQQPEASISSVEISLVHHPPGMYLLVIEQKDHSVTSHKVIVR